MAPYAMKLSCSGESARPMLLEAFLFVCAGQPMADEAILSSFKSTLLQQMESNALVDAPNEPASPLKMVLRMDQVQEVRLVATTLRISCYSSRTSSTAFPTSSKLCCATTAKVRFHRG